MHSHPYSESKIHILRVIVGGFVKAMPLGPESTIYSHLKWYTRCQTCPLNDEHSNVLYTVKMLLGSGLFDRYSLLSAGSDWFYRLLISLRFIRAKNLCNGCWDGCQMLNCQKIFRSFKEYSRQRLHHTWCWWRVPCCCEATWLLIL